jgi:D-amino-acid dehydrogenase
MYDAIIIGGGIVGAAAGYELARSGAKALLIDRHDTGRATDAGAGILSFVTLATGDEGPLYDFALRCGDYYDSLIEALLKLKDGDLGYAKTGELIIATGHDEIPHWEHKWQSLQAQSQRTGQPAAGSLRELSLDEARQLFPPLADVKRAFFNADAGRVDGRLICAAMRRAGEAQGLEIKQANVESLVISAGAVQGVVVDGATTAAEKVIIAGGAWTPAFGDALGLRLPIVPMRGQILHLSLPGIETSAWPIVHGFRGHYIVPWDDSRVAVGATFEQDGFAPHTTAAGVHEVLNEALYAAPGLAGAEVKEIRVGLRPVSADGLPFVGPVDSVGGVFVAAAHGAIGLQMGPYSGKLAADWAAGRVVEADISPFALRRHNQ